VATPDDVRRIALSLPGTAERDDGYVFVVDGKSFAWPWMERVHPKRARIASTEVIAVRVADELAKQTLLATEPDVCFTEPHYDGYPAVLVRLAPIDLPRLGRILADGWRSRAPKRLIAAAD
jgi:hypothetical protein